MARHILMYRGQRQRWLARKIASRQPLVARIAHRQRLLQELIPTAGTPAPSDPFNARFRRTGDPSWSPVEPLSTQQDTTEPAPPTIVVSDDTLRTGVIHHALAHPVEQPAGRDESRPYDGPPDLNVHVHHRAPVPPASPLPQAKPSPTLQDMQAPAPRATVVPDDTPRRGPIHRAPSPLQQDEGRSTAEFQRHDPLEHQGRDESRPYEVSSPPISIGPGAHGSEPAEAQDHIRLPELSIPESAATSEPLLEQPLPESTAISEPLREQFILESIAASEPVPEQPVMENREASKPLVAQPSMVRRPAGEPTPAAPSAPLAEVVQPPEANTSTEPERQQEQKRVDERAQEAVKPRRSRGRIMEQPTEPVSTAHTEAVPPSPPIRASHRKTPEEAAHNKAADDLFLPRDDTDRSPQAWLARLSRAAGARGDNTMLPSAPEETGQREIPPVGPGQPPAGREQPLAQPLAQSLAQPLPRNAVSGQASGEQSVRPAPAPLSQRARRLLRPLVGIDPTSINVYRDPQGEQLADTYQADAVTVGDEVILAAGHPDDAPETLGLLAHEFTHVARRREPRFVPPIARTPGSSSSRIIRPPVMGETGPGNGLERVATSSAPTDEEQLARRVERRVTRAAQEQEILSFPDAATSKPPAAMETSRAVSLPRSEGDIWGGLPAPWEPLPDWLVAPPVTTGGSTQPAIVYSQASPVVSSTGEGNGIYAGGTNVWSGDAGVPGIPGVQRAGTERSLSEEQEQTEQHDAPHAPEPDLDLLARQVYALLKRRLGVEHRRER